MQIMYAIFAFLPSIGDDFQIYFKNYMFLSFGARDVWFFIKEIMFQNYYILTLENYNKVIYSFPEAAILIIIFAVTNSVNNK